MRNLIVLMTAVIAVSFTTSWGYASGLSKREVEQKIKDLFTSADREEATARDSAQSIDLKKWSRVLVSEFKVSSEAQGQRLEAAIQAYLSNALYSTVRLPRTMRNSKLDTVWAKIFLGSKKTEEMKRAPITFTILDMKKGTDGSTRATLQLMPEFTDKNDTATQVTFVFHKDTGKIVDLEFSGLRFYGLYADQVQELDRNPEAAITLLLNKNLVTEKQIKDFSNL